MPQTVRRDRTGVGATRLFCEVRHRLSQRLKQGKPAANARQKEAFGFCEAAGRSQGAKFKNTLYQSESFRIERHQAFGVKLSEGNVQGPLFRSELPATIEREVDAFANADSTKSQQKGIGIKVIFAAAVPAGVTDHLPETKVWGGIPGVWEGLRE